MDEQMIWLSPHATRFAEVCDACAEERPEIFFAVTVVGELDADAAGGWAECPRGHRMRVHRISVGMPAGALR